MIIYSTHKMYHIIFSQLTTSANIHTSHQNQRWRVVDFLQRLLLVLLSVRRQHSNRVLHLAGSIYHFLCPLVTHAAPWLCNYPVSIALHCVLLFHQPVIYSDSHSVSRPAGQSASYRPGCWFVVLLCQHHFCATNSPVDCDKLNPFTFFYFEYFNKYILAEFRRNLTPSHNKDTLETSISSMLKVKVKISFPVRCYCQLLLHIDCGSLSL